MSYFDVEWVDSEMRGELEGYVDRVLVEGSSEGGIDVRRINSILEEEDGIDQFSFDIDPDYYSVRISSLSDNPIEGNLHLAEDLDGMIMVEDLSDFTDEVDYVLLNTADLDFYFAGMPRAEAAALIFEERTDVNSAPSDYDNEVNLNSSGHENKVNPTSTDRQNLPTNILDYIRDRFERK